MNNCPNIVIPPELRGIFEMKKKLPFREMTEIEEKYLRWITNFISKNSIHWSKENHLKMLEDLVYIEHLHSEKEMKKYLLKNQRPKLNEENCFEINVPHLDEDDPFVTEYDYVLLDDNILKIKEVKSKLIIATSKYENKVYDYF